MVRSYILNEGQRTIIEDYLEHRPNVMSPKIRQIRLRVKRLPFEEMHSDLELLMRLKDLKIPKGRKAKDMSAKFTVSGYGKVLNAFMESDEQLSVIPKDAETPFFPVSQTLKQRLNRVIGRLGLPILASVINDEVYLERTDRAPEEKK